jgi:hypothetical protein
MLREEESQLGQAKADGVLRPHDGAAGWLGRVGEQAAGQVDGNYTGLRSVQMNNQGGGQPAQGPGETRAKQRVNHYPFGLDFWQLLLADFIDGHVFGQALAVMLPVGRLLFGG